MRNFTYIKTGVLAAILVFAFTQRASAQKASKKVPKKAEYEFPAEMLEHVKVEYTKQCDQGQALYNLNCGGCHNIKVKGKMVIPDFKTDQLEAYVIRVSNPQHEGTMEETKVTAEELSSILTFLTYKKKEGHPMVVPKVASKEK